MSTRKQERPRAAVLTSFQQERSASQLVRAAIVGTFDVSNFGDLLFPIIAQFELSKRLKQLELTRYSYRAMDEKQWPYPVHSLDQLQGQMPELDLLLVGGGHLARFDKSVAPGYGPTDGELHHPTGYWLMPTLLGRACGVPVAWNCLGVSSGTPAWARRVLALAVAETPYVSVRDEPSARELQDVSPRARIRIVPDSAFGIQALLPRQPSAAFQSFCATTGLARPYILVQASRQLQPFTPQLKTAVAAARAKGCQVLELPISPVLGDCSGVLELNAQTIAPQTWPEPLLIAELIANAEAVIAQSLHLTIVALASGVPVHRPHIGEESKYGHIEFIEGVHLWTSGVDAAAEMRKGMGKHSPGVRITEIKAQLSRHWDTIAKLAAKPVQARPQITAAILNDCFRAAEECSGPHEQNGVSDTNGKLAPTGTVPAQGAQLDRRLAQLEQKTESLATARIHLQRLVEQQADQIRDLVARSNELEGKLQENATEAREQLQRQEAYYGLIARVRSIVRETLPAHSIITVVSNGDDQFLSFGSHTGWHFPRTETGLYLGRHPTNSAEAIAELDRQRFKGAQYLLFPETSFWWFESYAELTSHLQAHYRLVLNREDTCRIYSLRERT